VTFNGSIESAASVSGLLIAEFPEDLKYNKFTPRKLGSTGRENARKILSFVDDPANRRDGELVYDSMPRVKSQGFDGYPFIVIEEYTFNDIGDSLNALNTQYDFDIEFHVYGLEDTAEDLDKMDEIIDQINYLVKGPNRVRLGQEAEIARPQFIRQNRLTGINEHDQPYVRYEFEIRGKLHINMDK